MFQQMSFLPSIIVFKVLNSVPLYPETTQKQLQEKDG